MQRRYASYFPDARLTQKAPGLRDGNPPIAASLCVDLRIRTIALPRKPYRIPRDQTCEFLALVRPPDRFARHRVPERCRLLIA